MRKNKKPEKKPNISDTLKELNNLGIKIPFMEEKLTLRKLLLIEFITNAARGDRSYGKLIDKLINTVKVFIVATRKFLKDQCLTRASSVTYTFIVSLIPTLAVIFSYFYRIEGRKEDLLRRISTFIAEHNMRIDTEPIFAVISSLVGNAGKIGGISAVIMIFSATAMLRTLETSLNYIWKVHRQRHFLIRIVYYWAALTLGPMLFLAAVSVTKQMSSAFSAPDYAAAQFADNKVWISGSKATLLSSTDMPTNLTQITTDKIDFDNQKIYNYNASAKTFETVSFDLETTDFDFSRTKFSDIQFIGETGWVIGSQGIILYTENNGANWSLRKWGNFTFNGIHMLNKNTGFLISDNGMLFTTDDSGQSWNSHAMSFLTTAFKSIRFHGKTGIITGDNGTILYTNDTGSTWRTVKINEAKVKARPVTINDSFFVNDNIIWLVCDSGLLLQSVNGGRSWNSKNVNKFNYFAVHFFDKDNGIVAGAKGRTAITSDGGQSWQQGALQTTNINTLIKIGGTTLLASGDKGMAMYSDDMGATWRGTEARTSFISFLISYSAPFFFIWILFFLIYIMMPNTKVPMKEAAIGAAFTGVVWVLFILFFTVYVQSFAKGTFAIYGALASIPIFLLMIYASVIIVLYGAEVSYTLMHPELYSNLYRNTNDKREVHIYYGLSIVYYIYKKFEGGKGGAEYKELSKLCQYNSREVDFFLNKFIQDKIILQDSTMGYIPANSSQNIQVANIISSINTINMLVPKGVTKSPVKNYMDDISTKMEQNQRTIMGNITLKNIIDQEKPG